MLNIPSEKIYFLDKLIDRAGRIVIVSHSNPDGDAVGSTNALRHFLKDVIGKTQVSVIFPSEWNNSVGFILSEDDLKTTIIHSRNSEKAVSTIKEADLLFCLDMNSFSRAAKLEDVLTDFSSTKILIDHHLNPDVGRFDLTFSETDISSACELLFHILLATPQINGDASRLPEECVASLLTGLTTDTNNLVHSVFPSTMETVAAMLATGVDRASILQHIYNEYTENRFRLMGHILQDKMVTCKNGLAFVILDHETLRRFGVSETELDGFVNLPLGIKEIKMSFLLRETEEGFRVSIRSKIGVSANSCAMKYFHGGGHENAAGGKLFIPQDIIGKGEAGSYIINASKEFLDD